jgi:hypothetical protein
MTAFSLDIPSSPLVMDHAPLLGELMAGVIAHTAAEGVQANSGEFTLEVTAYFGKYDIRYQVGDAGGNVFFTGWKTEKGFSRAMQKENHRREVYESVTRAIVYARRYAAPTN